MQKILVWDWPVRLGHWLMVAGFSLAWLTSDSETFRLVHAFAGSVVIAVALFRLPWGFIGSRYARFADFVRGPTSVIDYLGSLLKLQPTHHVGHNPAGGWAIMLLLGLSILTGVVGWAMYNELGGEWLEDLHEGLAATMLTVVIVHVAGVISGSLLHGENLLRAMLTGHKQGSPDEAIPSARPLAAIVLIAWVVAASGWLAS
ncbi:cytochrome b/b6 domain-containing protein [Ferribacterium limneticum]|uniref:cytochrome b/b6 domain-containing protein n=1 Tax=Ferribacterium limneticum TaxID=76259 RepID=UPI001CFB5447|nr:cytochrome b/b6 domain-containing protein [Ferribacterium limneticum]UCV29850.1 cytochrome b/b6 domain-containing protein [Ferribacterium limneticum]UCV33769.1 cytochrome b/b6 domain-containing protein [Ferribacterium limneticum]